MKITTSIKGHQKHIETIERAEALIKELKQLLSWDIPREFTIELQEPPTSTDSSMDGDGARTSKQLEKEKEIEK